MSENNPTEEAKAFVDFAAKYEKERKDRKNVFKSQMTGWCKFFLENGISQIVCHYEGSGDSGCIENIDFFKEYDKDRDMWRSGADPDELTEEEVAKLELPAELKRETWVHQEEGPAKWEVPEGSQKVKEAYDYWVSEALPDGFEINEGGYGKIDFNVKEIRLEVEDNRRIVEIATETYEV